MDSEDRQVALVTGTDGLGAAVAEDLARRGWSVCCHAAAQSAAEAAAEDAGRAAEDAGADARCEPFTADLADAERRELLVENVLDAFDRIDMLVSAAAPPPAEARDLLELTANDVRGATEAALVPAAMLTQLVAREMVRQVEAAVVENPRIVLINSIAAYTTSADHGGHCVARAAMAMWTNLLADRLGEHGIGVYEVRVGMISAGADDPAHETYDDLISEGLTPIRRWGRAGDVARAVGAVAEGLLGFSTGEVLNVDGGFHLRRL
ncbi:MAG: SDR family oxidoreductase [Phycisphaerae bacterium]|nr:SDR family oxidoreductase [Phycisphaerae bacterium]